MADIAQSTEGVHELIAQLLDRNTNVPLGGFTIHSFDLDAQDTPKSLGYTTTDPRKELSLMPVTAPSTSKTPAKKPSEPRLHRYTSLPVALDVLYNKRLTLLSPETWEDRNDAYYLERYRAKLKLQSVVAICFSMRRETFHHWRVFSPGSSGVCLEFDKDKLLQSIPTKKGYRHGKVTYHWTARLQKNKPQPESWPFLKRKAFEDEGEYRITFESKTKRFRAHLMPIDLGSIKRVILSPFCSAAVAKSVVSIIESIDGCDQLEDVRRSSLIDNAAWRALID